MRPYSAIARATRTHGRVIIQQVCAGPRQSLEQVAMVVCDRPRWRPAFVGFPPPFCHVDPEQYPAIAESAGLQAIELTVSDVRWDFGSRDAFTRWCVARGLRLANHLRGGLAAGACQFVGKLRRSL